MAMLRTTSLTALAAAAIVSGCGGLPAADAQPAATPTATPAVAATAVATAAPTRRPRARRGLTVRVVDSQYGRILANSAGKAFYLFDKEHSTRSECYGDCAQAWPPVLAKGRPIAGPGVRAHLLGTARRRDGRLQVTYRGRPMYYYVADSRGRVLCHDVVEFGGRWLVMQPDGHPAR